MKPLLISLVLLAGCQTNEHYIKPEIERVYQSLRSVDTLLLKKITEHDTLAVKLLREEQEKLELKYQYLLAN